MVRSYIPLTGAIITERDDFLQGGKKYENNRVQRSPNMMFPRSLLDGGENGVQYNLAAVASGLTISHEVFVCVAVDLPPHTHTACDLRY
jgi:hypothetical protein